MACTVRLICALLALLACSAWATAQEAGRVTVFAASSLSNVLQEIADAYTRSGGAGVRLSFAASSTLAKQIEAGGKAQIFLSADAAWMDYLDKRGLLAPGTRRTLVGNWLVLAVPARAAQAMSTPPGQDWLERLPAGRIAMGDPDHVPAGRYAKQALIRLGVWAAVEPRLARADNVRSALVLVERGEAAGAIVYATDAAVSRHVAVAHAFPADLHDPIVYPVALLRGEDAGEARRLYDYLQSPEAAAIFAKHGFPPTAP